MFLFSPTGYEPDLHGIQTLTKDYAKKLDKSTASILVKKMMDDGTFDLGNTNTIEQNIKLFQNWWCVGYFEMIEKEIGWRKLDTELWPGKAEAKIFIKRFVEICPELTVEEDFGLYYSTWRRFYNTAGDRKRLLGITTGTY